MNETHKSVGRESVERVHDHPARLPAQRPAEQQREVRGIEDGEGEDTNARIRPEIPPNNPRGR